MSTLTTVPLAHRDLLDDVSWDRIVNRVMKEAEYQRDYPNGGKELAERIVNEALGFLTLCATDRRSFGPSPIVDIGWHTLILYTKMYQDLCTKLGVRFLHHEPNDMPGQEDKPGKCQACHDPCLGKQQDCGGRKCFNGDCRDCKNNHKSNCSSVGDCGLVTHKWCVDKDGDSDPITTVEGFELHKISYDPLLWSSTGGCKDKVKCACRHNSCKS